MTASQLPYKVVSYDDKAASVVDRATGERLGFVLGAYRGWTAHLLGAEDRVHDLIFATTVHHGITVQHGTTRYRRDAAQKVWDAARRLPHIRAGMTDEGAC